MVNIENIIKSILFLGTTKTLPTMLVFPYFLESHVEQNLDSLQMLDYKVGSNVKVIEIMWGIIKSIPNIFILHPICFFFSCWPHSLNVRYHQKYSQYFHLTPHWFFLFMLTSQFKPVSIVLLLSLYKILRKINTLYLTLSSLVFVCILFLTHKLLYFGHIILSNYLLRYLMWWEKSFEVFWDFCQHFVHIHEHYYNHVYYLNCLQFCRLYIVSAGKKFAVIFGG